MSSHGDLITRGYHAVVGTYLRVMDPIAGFLVRVGVTPNAITTVGTLGTVCGAVAFGMGHIRIGGSIIAVSAAFDTLDGLVARRGDRSSVFGAFYDSTLDRVADGAILSALTFFFVTDREFYDIPTLATCLLALVGSFLVPYTRARAEALGIQAKVGLMQRGHRVALLSIPQALFGLAFGGLILKAVLVILAISAWITAIQRVLVVRRTALGPVTTPLRVLGSSKSFTRTASRRAQS